MKISKFIGLALLTVSLIAPAQEVNIEETYEELTLEWLEVSGAIQGYSGLSEFCVTPDFRTYAVDILERLHHYDSVVMDFLRDPQAEVMIGQAEYDKVLKEIGKFESKYDIRSFISFLQESCITRNQLEKNRKDLVHANGADSFDGQVLILVTDISKFLRHIDKRIVSIDEHLHRIHPDKFNHEKLVMGSR